MPIAWLKRLFIRRKLRTGQTDHKLGNDSTNQQSQARRTRPTPSFLSRTEGLLTAVHLVASGWPEQLPQSDHDMRVWHGPGGLTVSLTIVLRSETPMRWSDIEKLRRDSRAIAQGSDAGLIEANFVETTLGRSAQFIYKQSQGSGFWFTGMLLTPLQKETIVWTASCTEGQLTGVREAIVTAELLQRGELTLESYEQSWAQDPYDANYSGIERRKLRYESDDERYDLRFPEHPLSRVRNALRELAHRVTVDLPS